MNRIIYYCLLSTYLILFNNNSFVNKFFVFQNRLNIDEVINIRKVKNAPSTDSTRISSFEFERVE